MAGITEMPISMSAKKKKLSDEKNKDEKRWMIEDAARTMKRLAEIKREIREIKADPPLFKAARVLLQQEIADIKSGLKT